jgi:GDP-L-fucose synthase
MMGVNVIEACHWLHVKKLVIAGTICGYPCHTPVPFQEKDLWQGLPEPTNLGYGMAKKMLLVLSQAYRQQYDCNFVFLLPVNLYGPRDNFDLNSSHVIPAMIRKFHEAAVNNEPTVTLWGDGTPTREFLYVEDCAKAFVRTLESYDSPEPMNIGSGKEIVMTDLANKIKELVGYEGEIRWDSSKPNGQPRRCLDTSRAKEEIEWESTTTLDEGLKNTYQWFLENKEKA